MASPSRVSHHRFLRTRWQKRDSMSSPRVTPVQSDDLQRPHTCAICSKIDRAVRLASSKQPHCKTRDQTRLVEASLPISIHEPPINLLVAVPLTTGRPAHEQHPGEHQDTLSGAARPTSRQPRSPRHTIHGCGIHTVPSQQARSQRGS